MSPTTDVDPQTSRSSATLAGASASPGVAFGHVSLGLAGLEDIPERKLGDEQVERELDRLESAGRAARVSLLRQREALANRFSEEERRIFDTHVKLLSDPVLEADVRERIAKHRMSLEGAVKDALQVYERLFEVVESQGLRNRMSDLRDVALRLLRHCRQPGGKPPERADMQGGVLVVAELNLSTLTEALDHGMAAIVAEAGNLGSHGSILTRAAGIPAVIGVGEIRSRLGQDDQVLVDGYAGQVVINPAADTVSAAIGQKPAQVVAQELGPSKLADGTPIALSGAVASPSEARSVAGMGMTEVGLYRTELPVIQRQGAPGEKGLTALYRQAVKAADSVCFRLPDLDSFSELVGLFPETEPNPALGARGCRLLRQRPELLNIQLRAILRASEGRPVSIAAPFVTDPGDLRAMREAIDSVREELRMDGVDVSHPVRLGAVIETPAAALLGREIMGAADFVLVGLDNLAQFTLAADRRNPDMAVSEYLRVLHPVVLRAVRKLQQVADGLGRSLTVYGESLTADPSLMLLVGAGVRGFAVRVTALAAIHEQLAQLDGDACERAAEVAAHTATLDEMLQAVRSS